jgi:hypothetical protein
MGLIKKLTHIAQAIGRLVGQFKGFSGWDGLISAFVRQTQDLENAAHEVIELTEIETAVGVQLDGLASIVGIERLGSDDDELRIRIKARIIFNQASGTIEEVIEILNLLTANAIEIREYFPAAFNVVVADTLAEDPVLLAEQVPKPAAVNGFLEYRLSDDDEVFSFATGDTVEASSTQGLGNDAGTTGGKFADVVGV